MVLSKAKKLNARRRCGRVIHITKASTAHRARNGPFPCLIWRRAGPRLENAPNVPAALDGIVVVGSPRPGAAFAGVVQHERPGDRLAYVLFSHDVTGRARS
jgi:hypothetical protein